MRVLLICALVFGLLALLFTKRVLAALIERFGRWQADRGSGTAPRPIETAATIYRKATPNVLDVSSLGIELRLLQHQMRRDPRERLVLVKQLLGPGTPGSQTYERLLVLARDSGRTEQIVLRSISNVRDTRNGAPVADPVAWLVAQAGAASISPGHPRRRPSKA